MSAAAPAETWAVYESPLGPLTLRAGAAGIHALDFPGRSPRLEEAAQRPMPAAFAQLEEYFAGRRRRFELPLALAGTALQRAVWEELQRVGLGTTVTYGELAERIDAALYPPGIEPYERVRAAAGAVARTPTPILVPCHRVIGADGSLTGYLGGLQRKQALLDLERRVAAGGEPEPVWAFRQTALL